MTPAPEPTLPETPDNPTPTSASDEAHRVLRVTRMAALRLYRTQIPRMAAALAYRTIFGLIPVIVISLVVFGSLLKDDQVESGVQRALQYFQLDQIVVEDPYEQMPEDFVGPPTPNESAGRLDQVVADLVERVRTSMSTIPNAGIAVVSLLVLIYAAISMLVEIERAFNQLYHAPSGRPWGRRLLLYWTMLTLGIVLLVATFMVGEGMKRWAISLAGGSQAIAASAGFAVTVAISTLLLFVAYMTMPNARVRWRSAIAGALVAAILWELGKWAFGSYVAFSVNYARFYGSLAVLPLFLLWVYVTWIIVLFGIQIANTLQTFRDWEVDSGDDGPELVDPTVVVAVAAAVAARFGKGEIATRTAVAERCGMTDRLTAAVLETLEHAGLVHAVERGKSDGFALARPPEEIRVSEVIDAGSGIVRAVDGPGRPALLDRVDDARQEVVGKTTLAELLTEADPPRQSAAPIEAEGPAPSAGARPALD